MLPGGTSVYESFKLVPQDLKNCKNICKKEKMNKTLLSPTVKIVFTPISNISKTTPHISKQTLAHLCFKSNQKSMKNEDGKDFQKKKILRRHLRIFLFKNKKEEEEEKKNFHFLLSRFDSVPWLWPKTKSTCNRRLLFLPFFNQKKPKICPRISVARFLVHLRTVFFQRTDGQSHCLIRPFHKTSLLCSWAFRIFNFRLKLFKHMNTVSAGFHEFGFNESSRFNGSVFDLKYYFTS